MKYKYGSRRRAGEYERAIAEFWKEDRTFEKSVEQRSADRAYVFYDGPPFITGAPHFGTLLSSIVKDAVPRYWTMKGFRVERRWGWDCHGLPAENFVEKQLGIIDRRQIVVDGSMEKVVEGTSELPKISLQHYIEKARESMVANSESWEGVIDRIGRWVDFRGAYRTMDKDFMESVWWAFKTLYDKGLIYEGKKVLMYDTKFATPVSKNEVTMDNDAYQTVTDPSVFVKFRVKGGFPEAPFSDLQSQPSTSYAVSPREPHSVRTSRDSLEYTSKTSQVEKVVERTSENPVQSTYLLAWTTTPWTLPANMALAVNPGLRYVEVEVGGERLILAKDLVGKVLIDEKKQALDYRVVREMSGEDLVGMQYVPILTDENAPVGSENAHKVYAAEFVGEHDGTGIVHIAPAYGEDDFALAEANGIPVVDVLDDEGFYLAEVAEKLHGVGVRDTSEQGIECWEANRFIAKCLREVGVVWKIEYIQHEYPFNPRSKQRIMYRAFPSWFFDVAGQKPTMLAQNENIRWFPEYIKHGRFMKNIEAAPDWNLSRDRFWATAMPVWKGDRGSVRVVGSYAELEELSGVKLPDYHRPWVDGIEFEIDGEHFTRVDKVLDCWFESGSMPFAQMHYPFENKEKFEKNYPADFIVEYVAQVRAWFYYVHVIGTALFGEQAFKNCIVTGTVAGNDGRKMSKSLGNYTDPNELMDKFSADSLRFLLSSSPLLSGEDFSLVDKDVGDVARKLTMVWNVYDFFTMYAEVDGWEGGGGFPEAPFSDLQSQPSTSYAVSPREPHSVRTSRDSLEYTSKTSQVEKVVERTSENPTVAEEGRESSSKSLGNLFTNPLDRWVKSRVWQLRNEVTEGMEEYDVPKALDGVLPFLDDLSNWFVRRSRRRFWKSEDDKDKAEAYATLHYVLSYFALIIAPFCPFMAEELWQKMVGGESVHLCDWPEAGEIDEGVLSKMFKAREIIQEGLAQRMNKSETEEQVKVRQPLATLEYGMEKLDEFYENIIAEEVNVKKVVHAPVLEGLSGGDLLMVQLDKTLTEELRAEGFARELIRVVQAARKKAGLNVDDRILLSLSEFPEEFIEVIAAETLAESVLREGEYGFGEEVEVEGKRVKVSLEKA